MYNYNYPDRIKFFYEDIKALKKLEDELFKALINILNNLLNEKNKHNKLLGVILKPKPSFSKYIKDISNEIDAKLDQLPEPILYDFTNHIIDRSYEYITQNEKLYDYQYFVEEIQDEWLLKWKFL